MSFLTNERVQRWLGGTFLERMGVGVLSRWQFIALSNHKDPEVVDLIRQIRNERTSLVTAFEAFMVYSFARSQVRHEGNLAEVGVFQGGTAKLLCEVKGDRRLYLFDTFEGLPVDSDEGNTIHRNHQYRCSLESVQEYLAGYENVSFHKGRFPETADVIENERFSFAHFDVDLYRSTLDCLEFFYPRMMPGGIMLSHDYSLLEGVKQAFGEFLDDKPEDVVELPTSQCMVIKRP